MLQLATTASAARLNPICRILMILRLEPVLEAMPIAEIVSLVPLGTHR